MNNKITYRKEGDCFMPNLYLPKQPVGHIGKYCRLRLHYLKNFKKVLYTVLITTLKYIKSYQFYQDKKTIREKIVKIN